MLTEIEEKTVARVLYYPQTNKVVAHLYDTSGRFKYRATVEAYEAGAGGYRATVVSLLAALRATVESDPAL
jgi:hypothetical protein